MSIRRESLSFLVIFVLLLWVSSACSDDPKTQDPPDQPDLSDEEVAEVDSADSLDVDTIEVVDPGVGISAPMRVAFVYRDSEQPGEVLPLSLLTTPPTRFPVNNTALNPMTTGIDCNRGLCQVSPDLGHFAYLDSDGALWVAAVRPGPMVSQSDLQWVANEIAQVELVTQRLGYVSGNTAYYLDLSQGIGTPRELGQIVITSPDGITYRGGGLAIPERGNAVFLYRFDLSSLAIFRYDLGTHEETFLHRFGIPRQSGSYFTGNNPLVITHDGATAIALVSGLYVDKICTTNVGCQHLQEGTCIFYTNEQGVQSANGLCGSPTHALYRFAADGGDLGTTCEDDTQCDPRHTCQVDPTSLITGAVKRCSPRAHRIGPKSNAACPYLEPGQFIDVVSKLRLTPEDHVLFLGKNPCNILNISNNAVVSIDSDFTEDSIQVIEGNYSHDFGQSFCYDDQEDRWDYSACSIEIRDFDFSPNGGLVLMASGRAERLGQELWAFDDQRRKYPLTEDIFRDVRAFFATLP